MQRNTNCAYAIILKQKRKMEYRQLGRSGLKVSALSFGTVTFGGGSDFFKAWGNTDVEGAKRLVNICMDAGINLFDTANSYSRGAS
jgi:aryl-alcohol dehydrogenase-like predicted oxidoreductase